MGTRHITGIAEGESILLANYGQWDGYPTGQGSKICEFLQSGVFLDQFVDNARQITQAAPSKKEEKKLGEKWAAWTKAYEKHEKERQNEKPAGEYLPPLSSLEYDAINPHPCPEFDRNFGADVLRLIYDGRLRTADVEDGLMFAADGVFCEWGWILDVDRRVLEVYRGFGGDPKPAGRFKYWPNTVRDRGGQEYGQLALWKEIPFTEATPARMKQLEKELNEVHEEADDTAEEPPQNYAFGDSDRVVLLSYGTQSKSTKDPFSVNITTKTEILRVGKDGGEVLKKASGGSMYKKYKAAEKLGRSLDLPVTHFTGVCPAVGFVFPEPLARSIATAQLQTWISEGFDKVPDRDQLAYTLLGWNDEKIKAATAAVSPIY